MFYPNKLPEILVMEDCKSWGKEDKLYQITVPNWHYPPCTTVLFITALDYTTVLLYSSSLYCTNVLFISVLYYCTIHLCTVHCATVCTVLCLLYDVHLWFSWDSDFEIRSLTSIFLRNVRNFGKWPVYGSYFNNYFFFKCVKSQSSICLKVTGA